MIPEARALVQAVRREFDSLPFKVCFTDRDPYDVKLGQPNCSRMAAEALQGGTLHVFGGGSSSSLWSDRDNRLFRAVHDWHHIQTKAGFDLQGEVTAFRFAANQWPKLGGLLYSEIVLQASEALALGYFPKTQKVTL